MRYIWNGIDLIHGGSHVFIDPEYGSKFDGKEFNFIICDECLAQRIPKRNALQFYKKETVLIKILRFLKIKFK